VARKHIDIIYNPAAGLRDRRRFENLLSELEEWGAAPRVHETRGSFDACNLTRAIVARGDSDVVVAAGGDGTINEVANGLTHSDVPLAIFPLGTANVLAIEIGLTSKPEELARTLMLGPAREIVTAQANGRLFLLWLGAGFDAEITALISPTAKKYLGKVAYVIAGFKHFFMNRATPFEVVIDGKKYSAGWVIAAKASHYAGRFVLTRRASLYARDLAIVLCHGHGRRATLRYLWALAFGRLERLHDVSVHVCTHAILSAPAGAVVQIDGEAGSILPQEVTIRPVGIRLVVPATTFSAN
jgi:YegS/Rv2252/BmrU family lipid kinase